MQNNMDINITKHKYFNAFLLITYFLINITYFIVNVKYPIVVENSIPVFNALINTHPLIFTSLSFLLSSSLVFYLIYYFSIKKCSTIIKSIQLFFLVVNPFTIKYMIIPGDNVIYGITVFFILKIYFNLLNRKESNIILFFLLLFGISLVIPYSIIIMTQIILLDYVYNFFSRKEDKKPLIQITSIIFIIYILVFYSLFKDADILSDYISYIYYSFINMIKSVWLLLTLITAIGFLVWLFSLLKTTKYNFLNILLYILLIPVSCLSFTFDSFNFPFFILFLSISFGEIKNISKTYTYLLNLSFIILSVSSFFFIINNYKMQMIFSENVILSIKHNIQNSNNNVYYVINKLPYSPVLKRASIYPDGYLDKIYYSEYLLNTVSREINLLFIYKNQDFIHKNMGGDFYKQPSVENKYYFIMHKNRFYYIFFKKN